MVGLVVATTVGIVVMGRSADAWGSGVNGALAAGGAAGRQLKTAEDEVGAEGGGGAAMASEQSSKGAGDAAGGASPRVAWVNPARCLASCAFSPGVALVRVDDRANGSPRGRHRVDSEALGPLRELLGAARAAGHGVRISSAFRSYTEQARLFRATKDKGRAARPGHSEHQLGTAIDLRLANSAAVDWLAEHAGNYGFALSYPPGKQRLTGYRPEPWHVRFVGRLVASELHQAGDGSTLEGLLRSHPAWGVSGTCEDCPLPASRRACGRVTTTGSCVGTVLTWCYEGALAMVDCAAFGQSCATRSGATVPDCQGAPAPAETASQ